MYSLMHAQPPCVLPMQPRRNLLKNYFVSVTEFSEAVNKRLLVIHQSEGDEEYSYLLAV